MQLWPIAEDGSVPGNPTAWSAEVRALLADTKAWYAQSGYAEPWISYIGLHEGRPVGVCSFKGPAKDHRVEIAYHTFPAFEKRGHATAMAEHLVRIARREDPQILVFAQTLPERNASHRVLEKAGFRAVGQLEHPDDGTVLEWHRAP